MPPSSETPLPGEQEHQWTAQIKSAATTLDRSLGEYASGTKIAPLAAMLTSFLDLGDAVLRPPLTVSPDTRQATIAPYQDLCGVLSGLLPDGQQILFRLLPGELDAGAVLSSARTHFGACNDRMKRFSALEKQGALADASHVDLLVAALSLEHVGLIAFARGPALGMSDQKLKPYREFYEQETVKFKSLCARLSTAPEATASVPPKTEALKPIELSHHPVLRRKIAEIGMRPAGGLLDNESLSQFPESIASPASGTGARTEHKGGHTGEGGRNRFISFFLQPIDRLHPLLSGDSSEQARHAVARQKAVAEILGLALTMHTQPLIGEIATAIGSDGRALQDALVGLRSSVMQKSREIVGQSVPGWSGRTELGSSITISDKNVQLLRQAVQFVAGVELGIRGDTLTYRNERFLGIGKAVTFEDQPSKATLRFMHLMNEVMRDKTVRERLGLESLVNPR